MGRLKVASLSALILFAVSTPLFAQQGTAQIVGKITDEQGALLPGVDVVVTNQETGVFREVTTSTEGTYVVAQIVPGTYKVLAKLTGFRTMERSDLILQVGTTLTINLALAGRRHRRKRHGHRPITARRHDQRPGRRQRRHRRAQRASGDEPKLLRRGRVVARSAVLAVQPDGQRYDRRVGPVVAGE